MKEFVEIGSSPSPKTPSDILRDLQHELMGVTADVEYGDGYDQVCHTTVLRVLDQLSELEQKLKWIK